MSGVKGILIDHLGTQVIETDRLILRRFNISDAQDIFDNWASNHQATKYLTWPPHERVEDTRALLQDWVTAYDQLNQYRWGITLRNQPEQVIGDISVVGTNELRKECEIGYVLSPNYWGQGIMTEALKAVTTYLLTEVQFNRLQALHNVANVGSGKVMKKAGLRYEGTHRQYGMNNSGLVDMARYAILRDDLKLEE